MFLCDTFLEVIRIHFIWNKIDLQLFISLFFGALIFMIRVLGVIIYSDLLDLKINVLFSFLIWFDLFSTDY